MDTALSPLRPLSVSDLIDETFQLYRRNFVLFVSISAVLMIPLAIIRLLQLLAIERQDTTSSLAALSPMSLLVYLLSALVYLGVLSAIIYAASELRMGRRPSVSDAYSNGMEHFPAMIKVGMLYVVLLSLMFVTVIGFPVAVYFSVAWLLSLHVAVIEGKSAIASLSRSRSLVKGNWWRVLGITLLVTIIVTIVELIFDLPTFAIGMPVALGETHSVGMAAAAVSTLFNTAGTIVTGPIIYIAWLLLYFDLRARKEGLDLELLATRTEAEARAASIQP